MYDNGIFTYAWGNNLKRKELKGRRGKVIAWGKMNSCLVQFLDNGEKVVTSNRALRKEKRWRELEDSQTLFEDTGSVY